MRYPEDPASLVLRPVVQAWLRRSGARSALPDAPVVPDRPRRRRRARPARPAEIAATSPATRRRETPAVACGR
jgi:hypothetical protein